MRTPLSVFEECYFSMTGIGSGLFLLLLTCAIVTLCIKVRTPILIRGSIVTVVMALLYCGPLATNYLYPFHVLDEQGCGHQSPGWVPPGLLHHPSEAELDQIGEHRSVIRAWIKPTNQPADPLHDCIE